MDPNRVEADDEESNAPAPAKGTTPSESRPEKWLGSLPPHDERVVYEVCSNKSDCSTPFTPTYSSTGSRSSTKYGFVRLNKPPVDKIWKLGAEDFRANVDDDPDRAEFCSQTPSGYSMNCLTHRMNYRERGLTGNPSKMNLGRNISANCSSISNKRSF
ncbi:Gag-Pol polyprotein [Gossypium australe]|uniref:Gag-Pol polyprotein n=1 Tax=Gossypium australe TaxID=47621 RepID=A0A5B6UX89_9ROSI|nr:Gag-Pol polyprotein [Gossypium australe]